MSSAEDEPISDITLAIHSIIASTAAILAIMICILSLIMASGKASLDTVILVMATGLGGLMFGYLAGTKIADIDDTTIKAATSAVAVGMCAAGGYYVNGFRK